MHTQRIPAATERCTIAHACLGQLAAGTHVQPAYIRALERGRINPPFHFLLWLIHNLGVTMPELFARHQQHMKTYPGRPAELAPA
jgi:transcriptional regulator with XRE-family HTH domain